MKLGQFAEEILSIFGVVKSWDIDDLQLGRSYALKLSTQATEYVFLRVLFKASTCNIVSKQRFIRLHFADGENEASKAKVDMFESVLTDFRNASLRLFYNPMFVSSSFVAATLLQPLMRWK